jgi:hypothetical protein
VIEKLANAGQTASVAQRIRILDLLNAFPSIAVAARKFPIAFRRLFLLATRRTAARSSGPLSRASR